MAVIQSRRDGRQFHGKNFAACGSEAAKFYGYPTWGTMRLVSKGLIVMQFETRQPPPAETLTGEYEFSIVQPEGA